MRPRADIGVAPGALRGLAGLLLATGALLALTLAIAAREAGAAEYVIGSPLSVPATLNTAENLNYEGTYTQVPPSPEAPNGVFHTFHYGADTAIWNVSQASGAPTVPVAGAVSRVSLEGCAEPADDGPAPLTEIHFQDITPLPGGGAKVNLTSQGFQIPVCGSGGASGSTITSYEPDGLCVSQGDYVDFNDEGGYVENVYRAGVPYKVLGAVSGSRADSFLRNDGTGNGATLAGERAANEGFATNSNEELLMRVTIGTGADATHICGGTEGLPPPLPPIRVGRQTDGINHERIVAVAVYCRLTSECKGTAVVTLAGESGVGRTAGNQVVGRSDFSLPGNRTTHLPIRMAPSVIAMIRRYHGVTARLTAVVDGKTITQTIEVKIL